MVKRRIICALFAVLMLVVASITHANHLDGVDWGDGIISVDGIGAPSPRATSPTQKYSMARRAAISDGYRQIAEAIAGVGVTADTTVRESVMENDVIQTRVQGLIRGARIVGEQVLPDGGVKVTMQINMYGNNSLASAVMPQNNQVAPLPEYISSAPSVTATGGYTGLIIDCSDYEVNPIMSPVIQSQNGTAVYGHKNLDPDMMVRQGMASYSHGYANVQRAGSNPLVIKAVGMVRNNAYPVISDADANRMLAENRATHFLENCKVVFIRR